MADVIDLNQWRASRVPDFTLDVGPQLDQPGDLVYVCEHCGGEELTARIRDGEAALLCIGCGFDHWDSVIKEITDHCK